MQESTDDGENGGNGGDGDGDDGDGDDDGTQKIFLSDKGSCSSLFFSTVVNLLWLPQCTRESREECASAAVTAILHGSSCRQYCLHN